MAEGVGDAGHAVVEPHGQGHGEPPQRQRARVDPPPHRRIRRVEHVEAPIETEPVDDVGALAAADRVLRFEDDDVASRFGEARRASQSRQPRTDHHDVVSAHVSSVGNRILAGSGVAARQVRASTASARSLNARRPSSSTVAIRRSAGSTSRTYSRISSCCAGVRP